MRKILVSYIIPAYNEECILPSMLECIVKYAPNSLKYEIIIADNGSTDRTVEIARKHAAVIIDAGMTVGGLRNIAVDISSGQVLVFLDADMMLTEDWSRGFPEAYESLLASPCQVTGSRAQISSSLNWIEKYWFEPMLTMSSNYINSGHLITTRKLFDSIGGFDSNLETGEDYAFGQAAQRSGAIIVNNPQLKVVHEGYPKSLREFIKREMWHGKGDCISLRAMLSSKVMLVAFVMVLLHLVSLLSFLVSSYDHLYISLALIMIIPLTFASLRHKAKRLGELLQVGFLYYCYFMARSLSCIYLSRSKRSR